MRHASKTEPETEAAAARRVSVLLPLPLGTPYDYRLPADMTLTPGDFVSVPLGRRTVVGVVWGDGDPAGVAEGRLKDVAARLDSPPMPDTLRNLVDWVARYTLSPRGAVLRMAMSIPEALEPAPPRVGYTAAEPLPEIRMTAARARVLEAIAKGPARGATELARDAGVSVGVITGLAAAGALLRVALPADGGDVTAPDPGRKGPALSREQADAAAALRESAAAGFSVTLLDGVTGAGKTEVYFEAVAAALETGRQVLVLVPEIALTGQWLARFADRFGADPDIWHSDLARGVRRRCWRRVAEGRARVVIGARSALFLPFPDLGLIVVDEEHDASYKQEDGVIYHARDMAVVRARIGAIPIVLASATPALETVTNCETGRYRRLHLPARHGAAELPDVALLDMRRDPPTRGRWLSGALVQALGETLEAGEQALLFLNRRGYAPLTLCRACGHRLQCPNCTSWLVEHRLTGQMQCHHCGYAAALPSLCPECGAEDRMAACGPGVERLAEEVMTLFPDKRLAVMTSDTVRGPAAAAAFVEAVANRDVDIIVGTQIVAKGHHFPMLTLVGVVDADLGLVGGDLRAAERTFQLLHQVAGRAGREDRPGRVLLQTYHPDHAVMQALADGARDRFLAAESEMRRQGGWPPFGRLAALIVSGRGEAQVDKAAGALGRAAPHTDDIRVLGPAPAPLAMLRGRHRRRLLLKAARRTDVQAVLRSWLSQVRWPNGVRVQVDVDPYSFL
ncbi:MAG: primosomal protein N' [Alphaproteobacteria bacterium]|nr:primosomal protein N' [Alphaproteobacteria bacterium]